MNSLNSIILEGNVVADPVSSKTTKGTKICTFSVAANRFFKKDDEYEKEVSYFEIQTWAKLAEVCAEHLKKGRGVRIIGRLKQNWGLDDRSKSRIYIIADHVEFKPEFKEEG